MHTAPKARAVVKKYFMVRTEHYWKVCGLRFDWIKVERIFPGDI